MVIRGGERNSTQHAIATVPCWPSDLLHPFDLVLTPNPRGEALQLPDRPTGCLPKGLIGGHFVVPVDRVSNPGLQTRSCPTTLPSSSRRLGSQGIESMSSPGFDGESSTWNS